MMSTMMAWLIGFRSKLNETFFSVADPMLRPTLP